MKTIVISSLSKYIYYATKYNKLGHIYFKTKLNILSSEIFKIINKVCLIYTPIWITKEEKRKIKK